MKRFALALLASAALITPTMAAGYIPIGPKVYTPRPPIVTPQAPIVTPQPDLVSPQPDLVNVTPGAYVSEGPGNDPNPGQESEICLTGSLLDGPFKNGPQCFVPRTLVPTTGGYFLPNIITSTPQPDLVTPQPDLVTPQPDIITPQPPSCKQLGVGSSGLGYYSC